MSSSQLTKSDFSEGLFYHQPVIILQHRISKDIPSGKRLHNYRKSPFYSWVNHGKSTTSTGPCSAMVNVYRRVAMVLKPGPPTHPIPTRRRHGGHGGLRTDGAASCPGSGAGQGPDPLGTRGNKRFEPKIMVCDSKIRQVKPHKLGIEQE